MIRNNQREAILALCYMDGKTPESEVLELFRPVLTASSPLTITRMILELTLDEAEIFFSAAIDAAKHVGENEIFADSCARFFFVYLLNLCREEFYSNHRINNQCEPTCEATMPPVYKIFPIEEYIKYFPALFQRCQFLLWKKLYFTSDERLSRVRSQLARFVGCTNRDTKQVVPLDWYIDMKARTKLLFNVSPRPYYTKAVEKWDAFVKKHKSEENAYRALQVYFRNFEFNMPLLSNAADVTHPGQVLYALTSVFNTTKLFCLEEDKNTLMLKVIRGCPSLYHVPRLMAEVNPSLFLHADLTEIFSEFLQSFWQRYCVRKNRVK